MLKRLLGPSEARDVVLVLFVALLLWEGSVWLFKPAPLILPAPSAVLGAFLQTPGLFMRQLGFTLGMTCLGFALVGAIVGEFVAGSKGLGFQILVAQGQFDTLGVFVCLLLLGVFGTLLFFMLDYAERLCLPWHVSQRGRHSTGT